MARAAIKNVILVIGMYLSMLNKTLGEYHVREMRYGSFRRSFRLHKRVMEDKVDATYKNGVLTVVMPLAEEEKTRKITVH